MDGMSLLDRIVALDRQLFLSINGAHAPWADVVMAIVSERWTWVPLYLFLLYVIQRRHGWAGLGWAVPVIAVLIFCSDTGSVALFKNTVQRLRPCHQPELQGLVHLVNGHCGGRYGFVSSHASNHFAIAAFMAGVLRGTPRWGMVLLMAWAALIAYSRVYLGVHFPADVAVGGLYGLAVGGAFYVLYRWVLYRIGCIMR